MPDIDRYKNQARRREKLSGYAKKRRASRLEEFREKDRLSHARRYAENPESFRARSHAYYAANKERIKEKSAQAREPHRAEAREVTRQWRLKNAERHRANARAWREAHPEAARAMNARWGKAHPEAVQQMKERRRARKANASVNDLTADQWCEIKAAYGYRCVYCGRKMQRLTQDHLTPLSKGGSHTASNIVPACHSCNSKKHTGPVLRPVQPLLLTLAPASERAS